MPFTPQNDTKIFIKTDTLKLYQFPEFHLATKKISLFTVVKNSWDNITYFTNTSLIRNTPQSPKYNLRTMFLPDMLQAQVVLFVFGELGKKHLGRLWIHLEKEGVHHTM